LFGAIVPIKNAWPLIAGQAFFRRDRGSRRDRRARAYLLLLREEPFSPDGLPRLLALLLPVARSLWAWLFWVLALPPLLAAEARPLLLPPRLEEDDDFGIRDAIDISLDHVVRPAHRAPSHNGDSRSVLRAFCRL
jgi:hypothetical protein